MVKSKIIRHMVNKAKQQKTPGEVIEGIKSAYKNIKCNFDIAFQGNKVNTEACKLAEDAIVNVLRPILSKPLMREIGLDYTKDVQGELLGAMNYLGEIYSKVSDDDHSNNHAKSAAIFQYCAKFCEKYNITEPLEGETISADFFIKKAHSNENIFLSDIEKEVGNDSQTYDNIKKYQQKLEGFRENIKQELKKINSLSFEQIGIKTEEVQDIYSKCSQFFIDKNNEKKEQTGFLNQLINDCKNQLGNPPGDMQYSIIGFGSLALGTMTPWSDLEFGILINENKEAYKNYARNLTKLLHIKIVNLGETPLRTIAIEPLNNFKIANPDDDWFRDDIIDSKFNFDGPDWYACKLPFGRKGYKAKVKVKDTNGEKEEIVIKPDYELIDTIEGLAKFQSEEPSKVGLTWHKSDKHLVQALKTVVLIDGDEELLKDYRKAILPDDDNSRMIQKERSLEILFEDLAKFSLKLGEDEEGKLFDVKKDIYRIADRTIVALSNYYNITASAEEDGISIWDTIDKMVKEKIFNTMDAQHLKAVLSIAAELRMNTYSYNNSQQEDLSTYVPAVDHLDHKEKQRLVEKTFYIKDTQYLQYFYQEIIKLQEYSQRFYDIITALKGKSKEDFNIALLIFNDNSLLSNQSYLQGLIQAKFLEYGLAVKSLEDALHQEPNNKRIMQDLSTLYIKVDKIDKALLISEKILKINTSDKLNHSDFVNTYYTLGVIFNKLGQYDKATEFYEKYLGFQQIIHSNNLYHRDVSNSYNNLGLIYYKQGKYDKAIELCEKALKINTTVYSSNLNHPDIAANYNNLGLIYDQLGKYDKAIEFYEEALDAVKTVLIKRPNYINVATYYENIGISYIKKDEYEKACGYLNKALIIKEVIYSNIINHSECMSSYSKLALVHTKESCYHQAIELCKKALKINTTVYSSNLNHPDIAANYNNLGLIYDQLGKCDKAIEFYEEALKINTTVYSSNLNHPDIAANYNNLGIMYRLQEKYDKAIIYHEKSMEIKKIVYSNNLNHPDIANSYNNLGSVYDDQGKYDQAIKFYTKALDIRKVVYSNNLNHPDIADSYNNLGSVYDNQEEYDQAIKFYTKALDIRKIVYSNNLNHPDIAVSYSNIAESLSDKEDHSKAIEFYTKSLKIKLIAFANNLYHPDIAINYHNLGYEYYSINEYKESIKYYIESIKIKEKIYEDEHHCITIFNSYIGLACSYDEDNAYIEAINYYKKALTIQQEIHSNNLNHPDVDECYNNLMLVCSKYWDIEGLFNLTDNEEDIVAILLSQNKNNVDEEKESTSSEEELSRAIALSLQNGTNTDSDVKSIGAEEELAQAMALSLQDENHTDSEIEIIGEAE